MKSTSRISSTSDSSNNIIEVGSIVIVQTTSGSKNGVVKYIGETKFAAGEWIGVRLEGPEGKNDGTVSGERYFECEPLYGIFVKRAQVKLENKSSTSSTVSSSSSETSKSGALTAREKYEQLKAKRLAGAASTTTSKVSTVDSKEKEKIKETTKEAVKEVKEDTIDKGKETKKEDAKEVIKEVIKEDAKEELIESKVLEQSSEKEVKETSTSDTPSSISNNNDNNKIDKRSIEEANYASSNTTSSVELDHKTVDTAEKIDIDALRTRIDDLRNQLAISKDEYRSLNESFSRLKADNANEAKKLESALAVKEEELSMVTEKADKQREEKEKVEKRLTDKEKEMSQAITKYENEMSQALQNFESEREKLEMVISDKDKEMKDMAALVNSNRPSADNPPAAPSIEDIGKIRDEVKSQTLKEADIKYSSIIDGKNNEIKKLQIAIKEASSKQEEVANELAAQKREAVKLSNDYDSEKRKSKDVEAQLKELKATFEKVSNSSAAPKVDQMKAQIDELNDNLELLTLDKEQLALDKEILEEKITKLERDLAIALESDNNTGAAAYAEENAKLRAALLKLNALSNEERSLSEQHKKDVEQLSGAVKQREQEVAALREFKSTASDQITDLKAHVDATALYEEMIEKLTEKNEKLAARNSNLEEAIRDLEATVEVSEELDTSQREEIAKLNKAVDAAEVAKGAVEEQYNALLTKFDEATEIINKFRRSADSLKEELSHSRSMYEEAVAGTLASSDLLRETNLLKMKLASLREKMIATEKSKRDIESLMWSMKVYNSRYDEVFSSLSLTNSEKKRLSVEVTVTLAAYKSSCSFKDLFLCIDENNPESGNSSSLIANYADVYVILMRAVAGLWQLSIKVMTEDEDSVVLPSTLLEFVAEIDRFSNTGVNLNLLLIRQFVSQAEDSLPPSLSSLLDECLHHCASASNTSQGSFNDISPVHVMIQISALANLILFASHHLSSVLTLSDVEIANILKSIKLEIQELLDSTVLVGPSIVVSMRNFLCNAFVMLNKIVELTSNNQDSAESIVFVNLKNTLSFVRNASNLLKSSKGDSESIAIFNIIKPQNIWKMIIEGAFLGLEKLRWKKAMATTKVMLESWEESGKSIKGLQESLENTNFTLSLRADELKAAKAANEELLGLLNKESEQKLSNDEVTVLREAIGVLEGRYANLENENRLLKKSTKLPVDTKPSTTRTEPGGLGVVDSSLVNSLTISRSNWKKMATIRLAASLQPLPSEFRPSSSKNTAEVNITKINRIARKARASIKIVSLGSVSNSNNDYNNIGQITECWKLLTAC